ncbi:hypothetical protein [Methylorubrum extorquens]|uniref:Uncharacterized protein n=1 Tax=Methylorubrum extorquens (strain ATCC 14718 / DSM 1338 / JCM 2805 / NCIMB 9133 / AM1) TaxID=272630 RepID=C5B3Z9_METEA|nr:hypothetical protein [Methylorubrum extorquens]ACS43181.1 Hypothetical protein MexAM1_META2p0307 [Methylorubrum extorquens AM1]MCP1545741.1 hypothetical protein [Methylorubrum extorquens]MCP1591692.1 hypothetical protein [Methylorubrum extorquens]
MTSVLRTIATDFEIAVDIRDAAGKGRRVKALVPCVRFHPFWKGFPKRLEVDGIQVQPPTRPMAAIAAGV